MELPKDPWPSQAREVEHLRDTYCLMLGSLRTVYTVWHDLDEIKVKILRIEDVGSV
jgi:hypothetical protein